MNSHITYTNRNGN